MRIGLIQTASLPNKEANLRTIHELVNELCQKSHPDLIALPELFDYRGGTVEERQQAAEDFNSPHSPSYQLLKELAQQHQVFIHGGSIREREGNQYYNTTLVFDAQGKEVAKYRKIHLFDVTTPNGQVYEESSFFTPGDKVVTYPLKSIPIGCAICYDLRFPLLFDALSQQHVQVIIVPSAFTYQTGQAHWELLIRARAIETQCFIVAPAQTGSYTDNQETRRSYGHSMVVDPWGNVIYQMQEEMGYMIAELDLQQLHRVRQLLPVLKHKKRISL
jgi:predicted amidohydrolase